jgi:hypothetical protein
MIPTLKLSPGKIVLLLLVLGLSLAFLEFGRLVANRGALIVTLAFWLTVVQGSVAVVAVGELVGARWLILARPALLSLTPLLLFLAPAALLLWPLLDLYPWTAEAGWWLNRPFFMVRAIGLPLLVWWTARRLARAPAAGRQQAAVLCLLAFVAAQSILAIDWVMSLEYPWVSTLLGAYYFVEALYAGLALTGLLIFSTRPQPGPAAEEQHRARRDLGMLLFGFSILWMGLFFAQYLLLWYGNLPDEVRVISERLAAAPLRALALLIIPANFLVPFLVLMGRRAKRSPPVVAAVSAVILFGLFLERLVFILPRAPLHPGLLVVQNLLVFSVLLLILHNRSPER